MEVECEWGCCRIDRFRLASDQPGGERCAEGGLPLRSFARRAFVLLLPPPPEMPAFTGLFRPPPPQVPGYEVSLAVIKIRL